MRKAVPPALARFMTPDPGNAGADAANPQSWNAFVYVLDNPTTNTDPDGRDIYACLNGHHGQCLDYANEAALENALKGTGAWLENGQIFVTVNGETVPAGTYQSNLLGPYVEASGPQDASASFLAVFMGAAGLLRSATLGIANLLEGEAASSASEVAASDASAAEDSAATSSSLDYTDVTRPGSRWPSRR